MFDHLTKRENKRRVFMASLFGIDVKEKSAVDDIVYNGDPKSVEHLSQKQKEELTRRLMAQHQKKFEDLNLKPSSE